MIDKWMMTIPENASLNPLVLAALPMISQVILDKEVLNDHVQNQLLNQLKHFETAVSHYKSAVIEDIHYLLCTAIDEFLSGRSKDLDDAKTYYGSYALKFHDNNLGGVKFFEILDRFLQEPMHYFVEIEFCYVLLALGFKGYYRVLSEGERKLQELCAKIQLILQKYHPRSERELVRRVKRFAWQYVVIFALAVGSIAGLSYGNVLLYQMASSINISVGSMDKLL